MPADGRERRKHPRLTVEVEIDFGTEHNFYAARTRDISTGGLFIETDSAPAVGAEVQVAMKLLDKRVRTPAEVVWVLTGDNGRSTGMGVRFLDLPAAAKKSIEAFMVLRNPMVFHADYSDEPKPPPPKGGGPPPLPPP